MVWKSSYVQVIQTAPILFIKVKGITGDKTAKWCPENVWATTSVDWVLKVSAKFLSEVETGPAGKIFVVFWLF